MDLLGLPIAIVFTTLALAGLNLALKLKKRLLIVLKPFRVIFLLNYFEGL